MLLASRVPVDELLVQSMPDASPTKWHLAHTTWFFERFLLREDPDYTPVLADADYLFNSYYEAIGDRHPRPLRSLLTRPTLDEVLSYRRAVDDRVRARVESRGLDARTASILELGIHHEQQHQELVLTDLKSVLAASPRHPAYIGPAPLEPSGAAVPELAWLDQPGGLTSIGHEGDGFAFDCEGPRHTVWLEDFAIASRCVTAGEWLAFVEDGGYRDPACWTSDGFAMAQREGWCAPLYWEQREGEWRIFTLRGDVALDPAAPVCHVSWYEADAYARWLARREPGVRLPTEHEWESVAVRAPISGRFLETSALHPEPVTEVGDAPSQMFGDVWEHTASAFSPYPRFRVSDGALGEYNGKFMCNQLVLRGGSCLTPRSHVRASYRNFFPPAARWQMTGVRLARWR